MFANIGIIDRISANTFETHFLQTGFKIGSMRLRKFLFTSRTGCQDRERSFAKVVFLVSHFVLWAEFFSK